MPDAMFHLTRPERMLIACLLLAFLTGLAVKHYRQADVPAPAPTHAKR
jgi:hypothetical protein